MNYSLEHVSAVQFDRHVESGRTRPYALTCETESGAIVEMVAKLRSSEQLYPGGLLCEAVSALLAQTLGLPVGKPYIVHLSQDFCNTIADSDTRAVFTESIGNNFATGKWPAGFSIWPTDMKVPAELHQTACEIFMFDAIIQNPDRTTQHPNCALLGENILIYDHELAFSNFRAIGDLSPWEGVGMTMMKQHLFHRQLRTQTLNFDRLQKVFKGVTDQDVREMLSIIPDEWQGDVVTKSAVMHYLQQCRDRFPELCNHLLGVL